MDLLKEVSYTAISYNDNLYHLVLLDSDSTHTLCGHILDNKVIHRIGEHSSSYRDIIRISLHYCQLTQECVQLV
jgi:hypothetical protein